MQHQTPHSAPKERTARQPAPQLAPIKVSGVIIPLGAQDALPPHEGAKKASSHTGINIQQLFEESYSLPPVQPGDQPGSYETGGGIRGGVSSSANDQGVRATARALSVSVQRRLAKISLTNATPSSSKLSANSSVSSSVDPPPAHKKSSNIPCLNRTFASQSNLSLKNCDVDTLSSRHMSSRARSRGSSASAGEGASFLPLSGLEAAKDHISKLTEREKSEIKNFKMVYYVGQLSAKKQAREDAAKNDGFDDKEGFYVCKARDHLLFRYEIMDILGKGTFGQVAKAWDHKNQSLVALKIVKNEKPFLRQAREEVRILEVLRRQDKHDLYNVVHILDSFKFRGHVCIAFELLGISLHQLLKKTRGQGFHLLRVQKLTRGILRCLDLLAKNRIIHCDIKPENILLRRTAPGYIAATGTSFSETGIKVIDLGSSCYEQQQIYTYIQSRYYRAPEVIMGQRYTTAIDIWSLACVIGELFTSRPLFAGDDEYDQLSCMMEMLGTPPPALIDRGKRSDKFFSGSTPRYTNNPNKKSRRGPPGSVKLASALRDTEDTVFLDFMQKALTWDPSARLTAAEALQHPWILRGQGKSSARDRFSSFSSPVGDVPKPKTDDKCRHSQSVSSTLKPRAKLGFGSSLPLTGNTKTASTTAITKTTGGGNNNNSNNNNSSSSSTSISSIKDCLTAKLPCQQYKQITDTSQLSVTARARAGPTIVLPSWDTR